MSTTTCAHCGGAPTPEDYGVLEVDGTIRHYCGKACFDAAHPPTLWERLCAFLDPRARLLP